MTTTTQPVKLDLGCGTRKKEGFTGVDVQSLEGVDVICDLGKDRWPWDDNSVDEVYCSHLVEHLKPMERVHFVNELWRVMKPNTRAAIITPYWASCRAFGDLTHEWPPVSEYWYPYLNAPWRKENSTHLDLYRCDFDSNYGYQPSPAMIGRSQQALDFALAHYKEAASDLVATVEKRVR